MPGLLFKIGLIMNLQIEGVVGIYDGTLQSTIGLLMYDLFIEIVNAVGDKEPQVENPVFMSPSSYFGQNESRLEFFVNSAEEAINFRYQTSAELEDVKAFIEKRESLK